MNKTKKFPKVKPSKSKSAVAAEPMDALEHLLGPEITARLKVICTRDNLTFEEAVRASVLDFVDNEFLADLTFRFPPGYEPRFNVQAKSPLDIAATCTQDKIGDYLSAAKYDLKVVRRHLTALQNGIRDNVRMFDPQDLKDLRLFLRAERIYTNVVSKLNERQRQYAPSSA